jgi:hypothetical protein
MPGQMPICKCPAHWAFARPTSLPIPYGSLPVHPHQSGIEYLISMIIDQKFNTQIDLSQTILKLLKECSARKEEMGSADYCGIENLQCCQPLFSTAVYSQLSQKWTLRPNRMAALPVVVTTMRRYLNFFFSRTAFFQ